MALALLQFIPLALAATAPTMVIFVTALLAGDGNPRRALAVVIGRLSGLLLVGFAVLFVLHQVPRSPVRGRLDDHELLPAIFLVVGTGLMLAAVYNLAVERKPSEDDQHSIMTRLKRLGSPVLFAAFFGTTFFSIRQLSLLVAGTAIIKQSNVSQPQEAFLLIVLCLAMIWTMLVPLGLAIGTGERGQLQLARFRDWMSDHKQGIDSVVLGFFGGVLVVKGIAGV